MKKNKVAKVIRAVLFMVVSSSVCAGALPWGDYIAPQFSMNTTSYESENLMQPGVPQSAYQQPVRANYAQPRPPFAPTPSVCSGWDIRRLHDGCIARTAASREGLLQQASYLKAMKPNLRVGAAWANVSNAALLQTVQELLSWEGSYSPHSFAERFYMQEIPSRKSPGSAEFTGYFTPVIEMRSQPNNEYRFPVYSPPAWGTKNLTRAEIDAGALRGRGLELAWTNDPVSLYFAHVQGSAIARFDNGNERFLDYDASNEKPAVSIGNYLRNQGYMQGSLSNENIRRWLHANPNKMAEVLHQNPRYIFFKFSDHRPRTATGAAVIPWHTIAVDDQFIPLGSVLLAEIPRIDRDGHILGTDWRLLFAQDRGNSIKGLGRFDLYTGAGPQAERATYPMTGLRKTYLLMRRPGFTGESFAGL